MERNLPTEWLVLWDTDNDAYYVATHEESKIDAAVTQWIDSQETRDTLLHLDKVDGSFLRIKASGVKAWALSTAATRELQEQINASLERDEDEKWKD